LTSEVPQESVLEASGSAATGFLALFSPFRSANSAKTRLWRSVSSTPVFNATSGFQIFVSLTIGFFMLISSQSIARIATPNAVRRPAHTELQTSGMHLIATLSL
jgi:hypothetical protein